MKKIELTRGYYVIVDDEDFEWLNQWKWTACVKKWGIIGFRHFRENGKQHTVQMHREILKHHGFNIEDLQIDHINHNTLDNRKEQLRIATPQENSRNTRIHKNNKSGFKGVSWSKSNKKWVTFLRVNKKSKYIGQFDNKIQAAIAYNKACKKIYGEFSHLNYIGGIL